MPGKSCSVSDSEKSLNGRIEFHLTKNPLLLIERSHGENFHLIHRVSVRGSVLSLFDSGLESEYELMNNSGLANN